MFRSPTSTTSPGSATTSFSRTCRFASVLRPACPIIDVPELHFEFNLNLPLRELRDSLERAYITRVAQFYGGSVTMLAKHAGLERTHLYRKIRQLGLELKKTTRKDESDHLAAGDTVADLSEETSDTPDDKKCIQIHQKTTDVNNGSDDS